MGTLSSHLNGKRAINLSMAVKTASMFWHTGRNIESKTGCVHSEITNISRIDLMQTGIAKRYKVSSPGADDVDGIVQILTEQAIERARNLAMQERFIGPNRANVLINAEMQESIAQLIA